MVTTSINTDGSEGKRDVSEMCELAKRQSIIDHCKALNTSGLNQGVSGNISIRHEDGLLISPTSIAYTSLTPDDIVFLGANAEVKGHHRPSSEWRFHKDIMDSRVDVNSVIHAHPNYCTMLAIMGLEIPPIHYMLAVFGGANIRCAPYEIFGSTELSDAAVSALKDRKACLLAHHGMISVGSSVEQAFSLAELLECLAQQYHGCLALGGPPLLTEHQIQEVIRKINEYGPTAARLNK